MAEISGIFNSVGADRKYTTGQLAAFWHLMNDGVSGVVKGHLNALSLATGTGYQTVLNTGGAIKDGYFYQNDASKNVAHDSVTVGNKRIDRIVVRKDTASTRSMVITVIKGTETTGTPSAPAVTAGTDVMLYQVLIDNPAGSPSLSLTDEREYKTIGNANSDVRGTFTGNVVGNLTGNVTGLVNGASANSTHGFLHLTSGSGNWTCPAGVYMVLVKMGGGGGGGGGTTGSPAYSASGGGSGGIIYTWVSVTPGAIYPYVVGSGGAGYIGGAFPGNAGNASTMFSLSAGGGGGGSPSGSSPPPGGSGGVVTAGYGLDGKTAANGSAFSAASPGAAAITLSYPEVPGGSLGGSAGASPGYGIPGSGGANSGNGGGGSILLAW